MLLLFIRSVVSYSLWPHGLQHARLPYPSLSPGVCLNTVVHSLNCVQLFATPWTAACQAFLSFTVSRSLLRLRSIELMMPSNHVILCFPPSLPAFNLSQHQGLFQWVNSLHQVAKVLELQLQYQSFQWFSLGLTGLISLLFKGPSRVFSNTTVQKHQDSA